jgi:cytochrome c556
MFVGVPVGKSEDYMKFLSVAAVALVGSVGIAFAQGDVINQRQTILKTFGAATRDPGAMLRGETAFDLAKVKASLATFKTEAPKLSGLFPDNSVAITGTKALATITSDRANFTPIWAKLAADATAADAAITNEATFKTEFPKVLANCGACHRTFRAPQ